MPPQNSQTQTTPAVKVGLTGGIGCGKSTVAKLFQEKGILIIDADHIAKTLVEPEQAALNEIIQRFGKSILQMDGSLDRKALRNIVFTDDSKLEQLESILHPRIKKEILKKMAIDAYNYPYIIVDVPLLIEKSYSSLFDQILVVDCLSEQQLNRVRARDKTTAHDVQTIMDSQTNRQQRLIIADEVLDNTGSIDKLSQQVSECHKRFCSLHQS